MEQKLFTCSNCAHMREQIDQQGGAKWLACTSRPPVLFLVKTTTLRGPQDMLKSSFPAVAPHESCGDWKAVVNFHKPIDCACCQATYAAAPSSYVLDQYGVVWFQCGCGTSLAYIRDKEQLAARLKGKYD